MKNIIILIGLPRSGKTTFRNDFKEMYPHYVCVSADDLRYLIYGQRYFQGGEPLVWAFRGYMLESLFQNGNDILIDETNTTTQRRESIIKQARKNGYNVIGIYMDTRLSTCISRSDEAIIDTLNRMHIQFETPSIGEGFHTIYKIPDNNYSLVLDDLKNLKGVNNEK